MTHFHIFFLEKCTPKILILRKTMLIIAFFSTDRCLVICKDSSDCLDRYILFLENVGEINFKICYVLEPGLAGGIYRRYLPVNTGVDNTPKSGVYRHLLAFINISLISLQITLLTVLATYYIIHGHHSLHRLHSTIFAAYA